MGSILQRSAQGNRADPIDAAFQAFRTAATLGSGARSILGRRIALAVWPDVFGVLDYAEDSHFLEPLLFVGGITPAILADLPALLNPGERPQNLICAPFFVPHLGYLGAVKNRALPTRRVHGIEVLDHGIQGLQDLVGRHDRPGSGAVENVGAAVDLLAATWPAMFSTLKLVCRRIVLFHCPDRNSFASEAMPGTVFVNLTQGQSLAALVEDVTHQAVHCLFSNVEQATNPYTKPPGDRLRDHGLALSADRTISVLHHSCLTLATSCHALARALRVANLTATDRLEIEARIGFLCRKMALDLAAAQRLNALDPEWHQNFWTLISALQPAVTHDDWAYATQGYNFNLRRFCLENRLALPSDFGPHPQQV